MHLLLCPQSDDLAWVQFAEAIDEAVIVFDVAIPVLELVQRRLEHLQNHLAWNQLPLQAESHTHTLVLGITKSFLRKVFL